MIFILIIFNQTINFEELYHTATTLLVQFEAEKDSAFETLITLGKDSLLADTTIDFLVSCFDTKVARKRHRLKDIFKEIGEPAIKGIVKKIGYRGSDEESRSLSQSLWVLGEIGGDSIVESVARFIDDEQWWIRSGAYTALGKSKSKNALPYILQGLNDSIRSVRKSAYYALSRIATESEIPYLIQGLDDEFFGVRYAAVDGLLRIGDVTINFLIDAVGESRLKDYFIFKTLSQLNVEKDEIMKFTQHDDPVIRHIIYEGCEDKTILNLSLEYEKNELLKNYLIKKLSDLP